MKLIFLDIDGTMIPYWTGHSYGRSKPFPKCTTDVLNAVLENTDAKVVLSSCWGNHFDTTEEIEEWFKDCGVIQFDRVIGKTRHYGNRTESIQLYLEKCEYEKLPITNILILDDETIDYPMSNHAIKCEPGVGLIEADIAAMFVILDHTPFTEIY